MTLEIYCDGGARGNPGPAAVGVVIGKLKHLSQTVGTATNNQAEYLAVSLALDWLLKNQPLWQNADKIKIFLDAKLVVNQLNGIYKVKNSTLRRLLLGVRSLENQLAVPVTYQFIPRAQNSIADKLVNQALDNAGLNYDTVEN